MDRVRIYPRKYTLSPFLTVMPILLLSTQVVASPTNAINNEYQMSAYSDATADEKTNSDTQEKFLPQRRRKYSISVHVGNTTMLNLDQSLDKVVGKECALWIFGCVYDRDIIEPLPIKFKSTPSQAYGIEYEYRTQGLWSFGGEHYRSTHKYTAATLIPTDGELKISRTFLAVKKYFEIGESTQAYVGVSGGALAADMRGAITSSYDDGGSGWSGVIGAVYEAGNIFFKASYRYSESSIHITDTYINDGQRRKTYGDLSTRSSGYFAGFGVKF